MSEQMEKMIREEHEGIAAAMLRDGVLSDEKIAEYLALTMGELEDIKSIIDVSKTRNQ